MTNDRWLNGKACGRRFFNLSFVILKELKASSMVTIDKISKSYGGGPSVIADLQLSIKPQQVTAGALSWQKKFWNKSVCVHFPYIIRASCREAWLNEWPSREPWCVSRLFSCWTSRSALWTLSPGAGYKSI
jgi:hypothetical protein